MKSKEENKRSRKRIPIEEKVQIICEDMGNFITEYADNISLGGMFVKMSKPFPIGTRLSLELAIGDGNRKISGAGEVVWTKEFALNSDDRPSGMGIKFLKLHGDSRIFIKEFIEKSYSD